MLQVNPGKDLTSTSMDIRTLVDKHAQV